MPTSPAVPMSSVLLACATTRSCWRHGLTRAGALDDCLKAAARHNGSRYSQERPQAGHEPRTVVVFLFPPRPVTPDQRNWSSATEGWKQHKLPDHCLGRVEPTSAGADAPARYLHCVDRCATTRGSSWD